MEDKRNESEREKTSQREAEIVGNYGQTRGGRNGHVAGVPRSTAHNARKRIEEGRRRGREEDMNVGEIRPVISG